MKRILVVGDIILDRYLTYQFKKMCPDRPTVPAYVKHIGPDLEYVGGAGNVAVNLAELVGSEGIVHLFGIASADTLRLIKRISRCRVNLSSCYETRQHEMVKDRIITEHGILCRLDSIKEYDESIIRDAVNEFGRLLATTIFDAIVVSDYGGRLFEAIYPMISQHSRVFLDTKSVKVSTFNNPYILKLNADEYGSIGMTDGRPPELFCQNCIVTFGSLGARLLRGQNRGFGRYYSSTQKFEFTCEPKKTVDVSGCGDTFLAALTYYTTFISFDDVEGAVSFANVCASSVVDALGTTCVSYEDVVESLPEQRRRS